MNTEIEKLSTDLATRAAGIVVKDQASADAANELIKAGKAVIKEIKTFFELRKAKAYDLWKYECNDEKAWLSKVEPVIAVLDKALTSWTLAEQRKRREAEEAARRAEEERQRLEAETLRKVKEAEEAAERDRLRLEREAEELQKKEREALAAGDKAALAEVETKREEIRQEAKAVLDTVEKATDAAIDEAAKVEATLAPTPVIPEAPRTNGSYVKHNYSFLVENKEALPEIFKIADQVSLDKMARLKGESFKIPGGKVIDKPTTASVGRRNGAGLN